MIANPLRRRLAAVKGESGFTLIEAVAALGIVMVMMLALTSTVIAGYRSTREARFFQQATALGNEVIEAARDLHYDDLVMISSETTGDPAVSGMTFDPDGSGPLAAEPLVQTASGGSFTPYSRTATVDGKDFDVKGYVTWVDEASQGGSSQDYKRITAIVSWEVGERTSEYTASAFITRARRGLPLPLFEAAPASQEATIEPGHRVTFVHTVRNLGIVDTYDISVTPPAGKLWNIGVYKDVDLDGDFDELVDVALTDTNGNGTPDTGSVQTNETFQFLVTMEIPASESVGSYTLTVTVASGAVPEVTEVLSDTVHVSTTGGVSGPGTVLYLHNNPSPPVGDTSAQTNLSANITAPTASTLYRYSTNYYAAQTGRYVDDSAPSAGQTNALYMVNWRHQMPQNTTFDGTWEGRIWVALKDFNCDKTVTFTAYLRDMHKNYNNGSLFATTTGSVPATTGGTTCGFVPVNLNFGDFSRTIQKDRWVELKIVVDNSTGDAALFGYDTTAYPAFLKLPAVSG